MIIPLRVLMLLGAFISTDRQTILLIGMHRSGTSVLARLVNLAGAHVGDTDELIPAGSDNPTGFWERRDVGALHEGFLKENGHSWTHVGSFDLTRIPAASIERCRAGIRSVLADIDTGGQPLLIKDPRLCLLLPLWQTVVGQPYYLFAVRDPRSVVTSLQVSYRNAFTTHFLFALWQKYIQTALQSLRGQQVLFVSYARVMHDPHSEARRLSRGLLDLGLIGIREIADAELALIDSKFNRSGANTVAPPVPAQAELHDWLLAQCAVSGPVTVGDTPEFGTADATLTEFQQVSDQYIRFGIAAGKGQIKQRA
jgi:hypothetical protein